VLKLKNLRDVLLDAAKKKYSNSTVNKANEVLADTLAVDTVVVSKQRSY
jgi:hypothetical protein